MAASVPKSIRTWPRVWPMCSEGHRAAGGNPALLHSAIMGIADLGNLVCINTCWLRHRKAQFQSWRFSRKTVFAHPTTTKSQRRPPRREMGSLSGEPAPKALRKGKSAEV
jgi:hypothetical protein